MSFFSTLTTRVQAVDSLLCVGLDPHPELLTQPSAQEAQDFCLRLIEATHDQVCAFKPNSAFFEAFGAGGWAALEKVIAAVPPEIPVILDAKRGDIASTAAAYARAIFEQLGAGAVTASPYLGRDSLAPFLERAERGVFLLCKTSNPGGGELQSLRVAGEPLYVHLARRAREWTAHDNLGLVVGATDPIALAAVRAAVPELWLLAPGIGPQGGDLEAAVQAGLRADGLGMIFPVSRSVAAAGDPRRAARQLRAQINAAREAASAPERPSPFSSPSLAELADSLLDAGCVRFGEFTLKSGVKSPIYFDLRLLASYPELLLRAAAAYEPLLAGLRFDRIAALPYGALPIGTALSLQTGIPMIYPRKSTKSYGTGEAIEGRYQPGETAVVVDDLVTTAGSKFEFIEKLNAGGIAVRDVVVLIDRGSGAGEALAEVGYRLHAVYTLPQLLEHWEASGRIPAGKIAAVRDFLVG